MAHEGIRSAVARYEGPLTGYAARILGDAEKARDVVQEAFLRLCAQDVSKLEGHLGEWLFTVCRNLALDQRRREKRMGPLQVQDVEAGTRAPDPSAAEEGRMALAALGRLGEGQREVLRLKFQNGLSYREIARVTGQSVSNVGFLMHEGLKALRRELA